MYVSVNFAALLDEHLRYRRWIPGNGYDSIFYCKVKLTDQNTNKVTDDRHG